MELAQSVLDECITSNEHVVEYAAAFEKHQYLVIPDFISTEFVSDTYLPEIERCVPFVHRVHVPKFKKSGSVKSTILKEQAPALYDLYASNVMKQFVEQVVGESVMRCPEDDPHAVALYYYTEPGDHIGVHYDKSFYRGRRYTILLGMIQDSVHSKLVCYPGASKLNRRKNPKEVFTHPGTLVIFNGDVLWHEVTPLGKNERRVILTMEFVTDNRMTKMQRFISHTKDRFLYFGRK